MHVRSRLTLQHSSHKHTHHPHTVSVAEALSASPPLSLSHTNTHILSCSLYVSLFHNHAFQDILAPSLPIPATGDLPCLSLHSRPPSYPLPDKVYLTESLSPNITRPPHHCAPDSHHPSRPPWLPRLLTGILTALLSRSLPHSLCTPVVATLSQSLSVAVSDV